MNTPTFNGRTVTRMHESTRRGAEYGAALHIYPKRPGIGRWLALLAVIAIALLSLAGKTDDAMQTVADDLQQAPADARLAMKE